MPEVSELARWTGRTLVGSDERQVSEGVRKEQLDLDGGTRQ